MAMGHMLWGVALLVPLGVREAVGVAVGVGVGVAVGAGVRVWLGEGVGVLNNAQGGGGTQRGRSLAQKKTQISSGRP